jgi:hypothetical protein
MAHSFSFHLFSLSLSLCVCICAYAGKHPEGVNVTVWTLKNNAPGGIEVQAIDYG